MTPVAYVLGNARSGSTVFGRVVAQHPEVVHCGELKMLAERAWLRPEYCSCGRRGNECEFWCGVWERLHADHPDLTPAALDRLQRRFDRLKRLQAPLIHGTFRSSVFGGYAAAMKSVFDSISAEAQRPLVLDTSKTPARAISLLRALGPADVTFIHLVRDPRAVVWSLLKSYRKDLAAGINRDRRPQDWRRTASVWLGVNLLSEMIGRYSGDCLRVRYEDFAKAPDEALGPVFDRLGLDAPPPRSAGALPFTSEHVIAGNFVRMKGEVRVRPDVEWQERMPADLQRKVWRMTGWLARRYGYRMDRSAPADAVG